MSKTTEEKISEMHDTIIRLEPFCKQVEKHEKALFNGGWGVVAQTKVMWGIFCILGGIIVKILVK